MSESSSVTMWFNPKCSKCRTADSILQERGVDYEQVRYLEKAPALDDLERVLKLIGTDDPRSIMRTGEDVYQELGLAGVQDRDRLLAAMVEHPILIERPIVIVGDRAVVARPPERLLEILQ